MNDQPRRKLLEIVAKYGHSVIENPRRLEALLRDYCGAYRREISVLIMAIEEHAVLDLLAASKSVPHKVLAARLVQRLCDNLGLAEDAARWSIETWFLAFGLVSEAELTATKVPGKSDQPLTENSIQKSVLPPAQSSQTSSAPASVSIIKAQTLSLIVSADGGGQFTTISQALDHAPPGSRLVIREGLYNESIILKQNIEIIGDGEVEKIIVRSTNSSVITMQTGKASVRGLTLRGRGKDYNQAFFAVDISQGELTLTNCDITSDSLSGVAIYGAGTNPLIENCRISDCADSGFYIFNNALGRIENCEVFRNQNVSVAITQGANPNFKNCRIFEGGNGGVVVWGNGAAGTIEDCRIYGHRLANIGVRDYANPLFRRCEVFGGQDSGIFIHQSGYGNFEECEIHQNGQAEVGISRNKSSGFRRCTIYGGANSGIIVQDEGRVIVEGCNIYDNAAAGIAIHTGSEAIIKRSNIHRNREVAIRIKEQSSATVENCDLRGNFFATWETEHGVVTNAANNRE